MCSRLHGDETLRYLRKCLLHRFRCHRHFLLQDDLPRFIQNAVARQVITEVQTNRELVSFENHVSFYPNSASLFHSRSPFFAPRARHSLGAYRIPRRPAFSSHLVSSRNRTSVKGASPLPSSYADFAVPPRHPTRGMPTALLPVAYCCRSCSSLRPPHGVCNFEQFQ